MSVRPPTDMAPMPAASALDLPHEVRNYADDDHHQRRASLPTALRVHPSFGLRPLVVGLYTLKGGAQAENPVRNESIRYAVLAAIRPIAPLILDEPAMNPLPRIAAAAKREEVRSMPLKPAEKVKHRRAA